MIIYWLNSCIFVNSDSDTLVWKNLHHAVFEVTENGLVDGSTSLSNYLTSNYTIE